MLRNDVVGRIMMKCLLSDMPELRLGLNEKIEDITFHQVNRQDGSVLSVFQGFASCLRSTLNCCWATWLPCMKVCPACLQQHCTLVIMGGQYPAARQQDALGQHHHHKCCPSSPSCPSAMLAHSVSTWGHTRPTGW